MVAVVTPEEADDLYCMAYISRITSLGLIESSTLNDIFQNSIQNNKMNHITGILCYGSGYFFQYVEGSEQALTNLKNSLLVDSRHQGMRILQFDKLSEREFCHWSLQPIVLEKGSLNHPELKKLLPFKPVMWQDNDWKEFLAILKAYARTPEGMPTRPVRYTTLGLTLTRLVSEHQAFFFVQALLATLIVTLGIFLALSTF